MTLRGWLGIKCRVFIYVSNIFVNFPIFPPRSFGAAGRPALGPGHQPSGGGESAAEDAASGQPGQPAVWTDRHTGRSHLRCQQVNTAVHQLQQSAFWKEKKKKSYWVHATFAFLCTVFVAHIACIVGMRIGPGHFVHVEMRMVLLALQLWLNRLRTLAIRLQWREGYCFFRHLLGKYQKKEEEKTPHKNEQQQTMQIKNIDSSGCTFKQPYTCNLGLEIL